VGINNSPFYFYDEVYISEKNKNSRIDPRMLYFKFKKEGSHMIDSEYGRIKRNQPLYLIKVECDDIMLKEIKEFYGKS
jgi:hypothetical protein